MRKLILAAALLAAGAAQADDLIWSGGGTSVRLLLAPCQSPTLAAVLATVAPGEAKQGEVTVGATHIDACWIALEDKVIVVDSNGNGGFILQSDFKRAPGV